jgi:hypothetical protein
VFESEAELKPQRLDLLNARHGLDAGQDVGRKLAVDLDQGDRVAAGLGSADVEGRDVDVGGAKGGPELADEAELEEIIEGAKPASMRRPLMLTMRGRPSA